MQNIDPILLMQPSLALVISLGALLFWWHRKGIRGPIVLTSAVAYFLAIGAKYAIQIPTVHTVLDRFGQVSVGVGFYYGLQTVFLEVGLAYVFARLALRRWRIGASDAVPYGLSLAFWENGIFLGAFSILNLGVIFLLLASGSSTAEAAYSQLVSAEPSLFLPPATLLPLVLIGTLERVSSMLVHLAWGMLCVFSAVYRKKRYLGYALPMGLVDALVPFASLNTDVFEAGLFVLSILFVLVALRVARSFGPSLGPSGDAKLPE